MKPYRIVPPAPKALNKSWTQEEIQEVLKQTKNKRNPEDIAKKLNRPVSEVRSRLKTIAAEMYLTDKIPYEKIHEVTGVEKNTFVLSSSTFKYDTTDDDNSDVNISIYDFPEEEPLPETMINVNVQDNPDEVIVTVSVESPFSVKSLCENISTPILSTCSRFAKIIS